MEAVLTPRRPVLPAAPRVASISDVTHGEVTDGELLERVAAGDRDAFDELYRRYRRPVLGLALRRLGDRGRAEDAVQDAFAAVWRSAHSYDRERGAGAAWLYTVARNAIVDGARRKPEPAAEILDDEPATGAGPDERAESSWLAWRVHRAIDELPEHERAVIELAYWSELSQREIAERLQIPLGTVKTRTRTGLGRLATLLEEDLR
jgi:RNA polymerase sigma-70 factor (ECF subfamily)